MKRALGAVVAVLLCRPAIVRAQGTALPAGTDTVTVAIGAHYKADGFHRFWLGGVYRDMWTMPIRVPVLSLGTFAGGLRPLKEGGGNQTKSLRFRGKDGAEYTFRSLDKDKVDIPGPWRGGIIDKMARDLTSNAQPTGFLVAEPILAAAGVLHVDGTLCVMPDDPALGEFRAAFAGRVGEIELTPGKTKDDAPGFANAVRFIDSDTLRHLLDTDPTQRIDAPAFLAARLVDMLLNDWDRHQGQWKWAQLTAQRDAPWEPIPRDRDKVLISASGVFADVAGRVSPDLSLIKFTDGYASIEALTFNSAPFDRRLLGGLEKPVWDSVAQALQHRITDGVIDTALAAMPVEFRLRIPEFARKLRHRRDSLPDIATRFYRSLASVVDVHATDAADRATITYIDENHLEVRLQSGGAAPYFQRRFDERETGEVRVYLHGGDDTALVTGTVSRAIPVRIVGGNGTNLLIDSSTVGGRHGTAHFYDAGAVSGVNYGIDTMFNRRPFVHEGGTWLQPRTDYGSQFGPVGDLDLNHDYGIEPSLGLAEYTYGFAHYPYSSMIALTGQYSFKLTRYRVGLSMDKRFERSSIHVTALARVSQLELVNFHGYGNQAPQTDTNFYVARQSQRLFRPALAFTVSPYAELSLAVAIQQSVTDTTPGHFVSDSQPYGYGRDGTFGEASLQLAFHLDTRKPKLHARHGNVIDITASYFPAAWDVTSAFESIDALVAQYVTLPVPTHPFLALRAGGKKLFGGNAPFQEAAFIGGNSTIRTLFPQSYAGDASLYATAELRIPVATFTVLVPLNTGLLATEDVGRVSFKDASPGGWHSAFGAGFWIGFHELTADVRVMQSEDGRPVVIGFRIARPNGPLQ